jgi:hypothetical protein
MGRMAFVPEGQVDSSQARSACSVPEGQHDRSQARSAWNSANPRSRPVGYGMIRVGVRTDSRWLPFPRDIPRELVAPDHTVPHGTVHLRDTFPGTSCLATISLSLWDKIHSFL